MFINFVESNIPFYIMNNISGLNIPVLSTICARLTYKLFIFCFVLFVRYFFQPCSSTQLTESVELLYLNFGLRLFFIFHLKLQAIYFNLRYFFKSTPLTMMSSPTLYFEFLHHHLNMRLFLQQMPQLILMIFYKCQESEELFTMPVFFTLNFFQRNQNHTFQFSLDASKFN